MRIDNMLYGALKFSAHPRAAILKIDCEAAEKLDGVVRVFTAADIPGQRFIGLIHQDWPVMVAEGEITRYIGDVLAGVVAETEAIARQAQELISVDYEILEPLTDMLAAEKSPIKVQPESENLLTDSRIQRGRKIDTVFNSSAYVTQGTYITQRVEHGFLETEAGIALPRQSDGIELYVQTQGVYEDQQQIARLLGISDDKVKVNLAPTGGGFGGKEDLTVQGHAAVFSFHLKQPVKVRLNREESIRMHPNAIPFICNILWDVMNTANSPGYLPESSVIPEPMPH